MNDLSLNMEGGVLIIGSLLWQDNLGPGKNTIRKDWRENQLNGSIRILVNVPIRYGRLSDGAIYTMTFANSARSKPGAACFVLLDTIPKQIANRYYRKLMNFRVQKEWKEDL